MITSAVLVVCPSVLSLYPLNFQTLDCGRTIRGTRSFQSQLARARIVGTGRGAILARAHPGPGTHGIRDQQDVATLPYLLPYYSLACPPTWHTNPQKSRLTSIREVHTQSAQHEGRPCGRLCTPMGVPEPVWHPCHA